jgi:general secretion pathway protein C
MVEFSSKKFRYINILIVVLIVIASLLVVRSIVYTSLSENEFSKSVTDRAKSKPLKSKRKNIMHYSSILEKNPFGAPMKLQPIAVAQESKTEEFGTLTDLVLVGTAVGPRHLSYAVFESKAGSNASGQEIFTYGENVFSYGVLNEIYPSSVTIERESKIYTVIMSSEENKSSTNRQRTQKFKTKSSVFAKKIGDKRYLLDSKTVQQSLENPQHMLTDARLLPNIRDGKHEGFSISEVIPGGLYGNLGLKNGDILLRINGLKISNPEVAIQAMSALKGMNELNLDIIRNGKNMSMQYQIR